MFGIISVIYCLMKNRPTIQWLKTITAYLAHGSVGQHFGLESARQFLWLMLGSLMCLQSATDQKSGCASRRCCWVKAGMWDWALFLLLSIRLA